MKALTAVLLAGLLAVAALPTAAQFGEDHDVPYLPSIPEVVEGMLDLAGVTSNDVVYDLGCGDGRIVIAAAKRGARGVGIDINPVRIREANEKAKAAGVQNRVKFIQGSFFDADIHEATVVTIYLLPEVNLKLRPKLLADLKPGTRLVSHSFDMGEWKPDKQSMVTGSYLYLWIIPKQPPVFSSR